VAFKFEIFKKYAKFVYVAPGAILFEEELAAMSPLWQP
jgi:hypothetical protein